MRMQGMRPAGLLIVILATVMCSPMPVLAQATTRSAQSDCQREAARNGYRRGRPTTASARAHEHGAGELLRLTANASSL